MKPEDKAREEIDRQLEDCGWQVQDVASMNISAADGVAIREFRLQKGFADYLLYAQGKAIAVVEAKPEGHTLTGVETQSAAYTEALPVGVPHWGQPLPFAYESTGKVTQFTNRLDPYPRSRELFAFHRPEELVRLAGLPQQLRQGLREMPPLDEQGLWDVQAQAIRSLERSLADNRPRSLIQMATGSGKTYTACTFSYRLIKHAGARRILFLVDRNNLGRQALNEFQQFSEAGARYKFTEEYNVQRLTRNTIDPACKVCITTIQRLYSILQGQEEFAEENEEGSMFESETPWRREPAPVVYNPRLPIEAFDFIVVDECHRSIYNLWRQVLEYFDAFIIGLTATPTPQTIGFFKGNVVQDYSHERAVADGVNVGYDVYRIQTRVTSQGAVLAKSDYFVPRRDRRTRQVRLAELEDDLTYAATQLDRDVVNPNQIRLVVQTFRDRLFTEIFPGRHEVPKTLVFAKTDLHADDIVKIVREEFGKGNEFCQKITSKTTGKKPEELLNEFRNSYHPRIAVTVDMIATGTDVKPLECVLFMRNIRSASYFEQMKGRGSRVIQPDDLLAVTPDARYKTRYVVVDAVGVCENDKTSSKPLDRRPTLSLKQILMYVGQGMANVDLVSTLASRLSRLGRRLNDQQQDEIAQAAGGTTLADLTASLLESIDPDLNWKKAQAKFDLPEDGEPSEEQLDEVERESMSDALRGFHDPDLRTTILEIEQISEQVIDEITQDRLLQAGFDAAAQEKARSQLEDFRRFVEDHKDQIEALQILYSRPYRAGLRYRHVKELAQALERPPLSIPEPNRRLWMLYQSVEPEKVHGRGGQNLVDLVALVRHAIQPEEPLVPVAAVVEERYQEWLKQQESAGVSFPPEQRQWLDAIKDHIAASLRMEQEDFDYAPFSQMGGLGKAYEVFGDRLTGILEEMNERLAA